MRNQISRQTATEAARDFSALLSRVAKGEEVIIERHGVPVAVIKPPYDVPRTAEEMLAMPWPRPSAVADDQFADDLEEIINSRDRRSFDPWEDKWE